MEPAAKKNGICGNDLKHGYSVSLSTLNTPIKPQKLFQRFPIFFLPQAVPAARHCRSVHFSVESLRQLMGYSFQPGRYNTISGHAGILKISLR